MLSTQISYWANQESKRHNLEQETQNWEDLRRRELEYLQTVKYQAQQIGYMYDELKETIRHDKATEKINLKQAKAAYNSSIAAMRTASANLANAMTNAKNATTKRKEYESTAAYQSAMSYKAKQEAKAKKTETKYKSKQTKYYVWTDVVPKYLNAGSETLKIIGGSVPKLGKVSSIKKGLKASGWK